MKKNYEKRLIAEVESVFSDKSVYERSSIYEKVEDIFRKLRPEIQDEREFLSDLELRILDLFRDSKKTFWSSEDVIGSIVKLLKGKWGWWYEYKDQILSFIATVLFDFVFAFFVTIVFNLAFGDLYTMTWGKSLAFMILFDIFSARYKKLNW